MDLRKLGKVFDESNVDRLLRGEQFIELIPYRHRHKMAEKRINRLVKSEAGASRTERAGRMKAGIPGYADERSILAELEYCDRIFRSIPGLRVIDVSNRSIEETSDWIIRNVL